MSLQADARLARRRRTELAWGVVLRGCALLCLVTLAVLVIRLLADGAAALDLDFWTQDYSGRGLVEMEKRGTSDPLMGIKDALLTSLVVLALTMVIALPVGTAAGVYLHEYAGRGRLTGWIRATVTNLAGVPSVVYGLLGLAVFVRLLGLGATNIASALTLAVLVLPILIVATEEALRTIPATVREASLAMGATKWQTVRHHVLPYAVPGILTGQVLALSRAAGETAPLLILGIPLSTSFVSYAPDAYGTPLQVRAYYLSQEAGAAAAALAGATVVVLLLATLALNLTAIILRHVLAKRIRW